MVKLLVGSGRLYLHDAGTAMPAIGADPAAAGWADLGAIDGGVGVQREQTLEELFVDDETGPVDVTRTAESLRVRASLAEPTLTRLGAVLSRRRAVARGGAAVHRDAGRVPRRGRREAGAALPRRLARGAGQARSDVHPARLLRRRAGHGAQEGRANPRRGRVPRPGRRGAGEPGGALRRHGLRDVTGAASSAADAEKRTSDTEKKSPMPDPFTSLLDLDRGRLPGLMLRLDGKEYPLRAPEALSLGDAFVWAPRSCGCGRQPATSTRRRGRSEDRGDHRAEAARRAGPERRG